MAKSPPANPNFDVNADGTVNIADVLLVIEALDDPVSCCRTLRFGETITTLDPARLAMQIDLLRAESDGSMKYEQAIAFFQSPSGIHSVLPRRIAPRKLSEPISTPRRGYRISSGSAWGSYINGSMTVQRDIAFVRAYRVRASARGNVSEQRSGGVLGRHKRTG